MLDACGPPHVYKDTPKTQAGLMCWFEKLQRMYCGKEGKRWSYNGLALLWVVG